MPVMLKLFINGNNKKSHRQVEEIQAMLAEELTQGVELQVIDVAQDPASAHQAGVRATPTLVKTAPGPERRVIGDLSDPRRILAGLEIATPSDGAPWRD